MSNVRKLRFSFLAAALVLSAGVSLAASDAFAAAASAAAGGAASSGSTGTGPGAAGTGPGATGTGGGATGTGGGPTGTGGGAPPRCGAACNPPPPPHRIAYAPLHPRSACAHREPAFDRFGRYLGEIVVNSCFADE